MVACDVRIETSAGLHTRPGTLFVQEAKKYACSVTVKQGAREFNAKSLLKLMKLGVAKGDVVTIVCEGPDEREALDALTSLVASFDE